MAVSLSSWAISQPVPRVLVQPLFKVEGDHSRLSKPCQACLICYSRQTMYTIKEASARSGVPIPLLRAWERRYGVVRPARTAAAYRLYADEDIARLRAMRRLLDDGWSA